MVNKLSEGSNLIWESSRMMLPEHKARIREHDLTPPPKDRPILSEDQLTQINQHLSIAINTKAYVTLTYYKNKQYLSVTGTHLRLLSTKTLEIETDKGYDHILLKDIIDVAIDLHFD
ncbi:MAG: YolD-like family protein [Bacillota bacterium]